MELTRKFQKCLIAIVIIFVSVGLYLQYNIKKLKHQPTFANFIEDECPRQSEITLVTAFFYKTNRSKHTLKEYKRWISNFFPHVHTPMVIFTESRFAPLFRKQRQGLPTLILSEFKDVWALPSMDGLKDKYGQLHKIDPERKIHSPELYAVWNSKSWMLSYVSKTNPFNSSYFFWLDVGIYREGKNGTKCYPNIEKVEEVFRGEQADKIHLFAVNKFRNYKNGSNRFEDMRPNFVQGTFFGGKRSGVKWFADAFYSAHDQFLSNGKFVGKDQDLMNWVAVQNPEHVLFSCRCQGKIKGCGRDNIWFYFKRWYNPKGNKQYEEDKSCEIEMLAPENGRGLLLQKLARK